MIKNKLFKIVFCLLAALVLSLPGARPALAAPPVNDNFTNATAIPSLPFSDAVDISAATTELDEPQFCNFMPQTVWYVLTPIADAVVRADMSGSSFSDTLLNVYRSTGPGFGDLSFLNCASFGDSITFSVQAGNTYYIQAGSIFGSGGTLQLNLQEVLPPPNDDFADATIVPGIPFTDSVNNSGASLEPGEPSTRCGTPANTVWYAFKATTTDSVMSRLSGRYGTFLNIYSGTSLSNLVEVGCQTFGSPITFRAIEGVTYFFQAGTFSLDIGQIVFELDVPPPPVANFGFSPDAPSIFDTVQFFDNSFDPGGSEIQSREWNFGDGTMLTTTGCCPTHRYTADGDYTVQLTVKTFDGRSASTFQVVRVRTHDVAITKFSVPKSASAGQTRTIMVGIRNHRYPETVRVELWKSIPGGFTFVGSSMQLVPVRPSNRTTDFAFSYTFTEDDARIGKVTFKAFAMIEGAQDALPADNEAIAPPTKVSKEGRAYGAALSNTADAPRAGSLLGVLSLGTFAGVVLVVGTPPRWRNRRDR